MKNEYLLMRSISRESGVPTEFVQKISNEVEKKGFLKGILISVVTIAIAGAVYIGTKVLKRKLDSIPNKERSEE